MAPLLEARGLEFGYGAPVLRELDVELASGRCLAVLGANGAGKTTLLRLLGGLRRPDRGVVRIAGRPVTGLRPAERVRLLGYLPQTIPAARGFAVHEVVLMGLYALLPERGWEGMGEWRAVLRALRRVGAGGLARRRFDQLSGGEQRRVLIARALVAEPRVLLLDEPLASLDPGFSLELIDVLRKIKEDGVGVVVSTHHLGLTRALADQVLVLRDGRELARGSVDEALRPTVLDRAYDTDRFGSPGGLATVDWLRSRIS